MLKGYLAQLGIDPVEAGARLLDVTAAARIVGVSRGTIYRLIERGQIAPVDAAGRNRIPLSQLLAIATPSTEAQS